MTHPTLLRTPVALSGSREASSLMLDYTDEVVRRLAKGRFVVLSGDNPQGVDLAIAKACRRYRVFHNVYGIDPQPRFGDYGQYNQLTDWERINGFDGTPTRKQLFTARDYHMIDQARVFLGIWNGTSSGTENAYNYAVSRFPKLQACYLVKPTEGIMKYHRWKVWSV